MQPRLEQLILAKHKTLKLKTKHLRELNDSKNSLLQSYLNQNLEITDVFFDFLSELSIKVENSPLEDPKVLELGLEVGALISKYQEKFSGIKKPTFDFEVFSSLFGIRKMTQEKNLELRAIFDELQRTQAEG